MFKVICWSWQLRYYPRIYSRLHTYYEFQLILNIVYILRCNFNKLFSIEEWNQIVNARMHATFAKQLQVSKKIKRNKIVDSLFLIIFSSTLGYME